MVTIDRIKGQDRATVKGDAASPQLPADTCETTIQPNLCSRCGNVRPLTHRVHSDLVDQTVCGPCAAEVPLASRGLGALTVERIIAI